MQIAITKIGRTIDVSAGRLVIDPTLTDSVNTDNGAELERLINQSPALAYIVKYGLTQSLNDAHAAEKYDGSSVTQADNIQAIVEKKLAAIYSGEIAMRGVGAPRDPVGSLVHRFAADEIRESMRKQGKKPSAVDKTVFESGVQKYIERNRDRLVAAANEWIAAKANVAVDLTEIGL